ncbi:hypothetical protein [Inquilinus sp. OTU3971]|uniref:hypothetical protein n=1 Tax=Inquilinus sp. OTU3971 TaxID=3043855 RepID=UPI00313CD77B
MEKPEPLWEFPELERLHARLEAEYELRDRARALDAKLDLLSRSCETLIGLVQARRSLRVEWYVVFLIVAELCLSIFALDRRARPGAGPCGRGRLDPGQG